MQQGNKRESIIVDDNSPSAQDEEQRESIAMSDGFGFFKLPIGALKDAYTSPQSYLTLSCRVTQPQA